MTDTDLVKRSCKPCKRGDPALSEAQVRERLGSLNGWQIVQGTLTKTFAFKNYYEATAFVNASAWISHREDHHPDIALGYNKVTVRYITHDVGGLSDNDFICAAKTDALFLL